MKIDELLAHLATTPEGEEPEEFEEAEEDGTLALALALLQECGELFDRLTDKREKKLSKQEMFEIGRASDAVYEFLNSTEDEPAAWIEVRK